MSRLVVSSYNEFAAFEGRELGASDWLLIDQNRINLFADATLDRQWIHVDANRAKKESLCQSTIAHGYPTFSLLPYLWSQIIEVDNIKMLASYDMDKMYFGQAVVIESRVHTVTKLRAISSLRGVYKTKVNFKIEVEGQRKPVLGGIATFLYYLKQRAMVRPMRR